MKRPEALAWLLAYVVLLTLVIGGAFYGRRQALTIYGTPSEQRHWDQWRGDAKKMAEQPGPVKRREPKSTEPPALVLMRDHFGVCLALAALLSSVLFGTFMFFLRGALSSPGPRPPTPDS